MASPDSEGLRYVMGTLLSVRVSGAEPEAAQRVKDGIFERIQRLEDLWSVFKPTSDLSRMNALAGRESVRVDPETLLALERALSFARLSGGACDPTIGPLLRAWGFGRRRGLFPRENELRSARALVDYRLLRLDPDARTVFLPNEGMALDLGWIGKGLAMDRALEEATSVPSIDRVSMDFGGHLLFWGRQALPPERIVIDLPGWPLDRLPSFYLRGARSVSTTSNGERRVALENRQTGRSHEVGHILDPRTGHPAQGTESVTVTAQTAAEADALSTAVFVLGRQEGFALLEQVPGAAALVVGNRDGQSPAVAATPGWPNELAHA